MNFRPSLTRPRVLMITHRFVHPPNRGDRIRTWHTLMELSRHADVSLACVADEPIRTDHWEAVYAHVERLAIEPMPHGGKPAAVARALASGRSVTEEAFYSPALHRTIREWAEDFDFDAVLGVCTSTARYLEGLDVPTRVVDLIDVDSAKWAEYAEHAHGFRRWLYTRESTKLAALERSLGETSQLAVTCEREAELLATIAPEVTPIISRNGVETAERTGASAPAGEQGSTVVFTGVLDYQPNVEGVKWFAREVWPTVKSRVPDAKFDIVGMRPTREVKALGKLRGVRVVGEVPSTEPYLERARVAVAPLHIARGVQNKALQAMAAARPVVVTPAVQAGLSVSERCPAIEATTPAEWADVVTGLLTDRRRASAFGTWGRLYVDQNYRWEQAATPIVTAIIGGQLPSESVDLTGHENTAGGTNVVAA